MESFAVSRAVADVVLPAGDGRRMAARSPVVRTGRTAPPSPGCVRTCHPAAAAHAAGRLAHLELRQQAELEPDGRRQMAGGHTPPPRAAPAPADGVPLRRRAVELRELPAVVPVPPLTAPAPPASPPPAVPAPPASPPRDAPAPPASPPLAVPAPPLPRPLAGPAPLRVCSARLGGGLR